MIKQVAKQHVSQGIHEYWWDGSSANGSKLNTGIYMYRVVTSTDIQTGSLVLIK
jgi:flagellar hook assembly protein FlgD